MFFNIRFAAQSPIVLMPVLFVFYRTHEGQEINNSMDYLKFGYLYFQELIKNVTLPLKKNEIQYLYRKLQKRHSVNLSKYFWRTKSIKSTLNVMSATDFSVANFIVSFFK